MKQLFEVVLKPGLGKPVYVDADNADEAKNIAIGVFRKRQTAIDDWTIGQCIQEVKLSDKTAVQYG